MRLPGLFAALVLLIATAAPAAAQNRFWLQNNTGQTIVSANVSPSRVTEWGPNILLQGPLRPGMQVHVEPTFRDCYLDIRVRFADGTEDGHLGVHACTLSRITFGRDAPQAPAPPPPPLPREREREVQREDPSFIFVNRSGEPIREVYVSLTSQRSWGRDRLGPNQILPPGASMPIGLPRAGVCTVDMRVVYMDGRILEQRNIETCSIRNYAWR